MILMYHKVDLVAPTMWWVTANNFYRQMLELSDREVVFLDDYENETCLAQICRCLVVS